MPEAPTVWSGESGAIKSGATVYAAIRDWKASGKADNQAVIDSGTSGGTTRLGGNLDWSGSWSADGYPTVKPGDAVVFTGSIDNVEGLTGPIIVESVRVNYDIAGGKPITHDVTFSGNGAWTLGAATAADAAVAAPVSSVGVVVQLAAPAALPTWVNLEQVETITLEFKRSALAYVDSTSAGWNKRKRGPFDATIAIKVHPDATATDVAYGLQGLPSPRVVKMIKITDAQTTPGVYALNWMMFSDISDVDVNRETQAIVSCTLNAALCATTSIATVMTLGTVTGPNAQTLWP
ncbi:MAG TPA: hypothetical protein PK867_04990 [Pirellulales bacterium]|nr:hypothetical protein [Pirellulales bacterium]